MSGIVGLLNLDGEPVDRDLLQCLTDTMAFRGPDRQDIWLEGKVGFGYTALDTSDEDRCGRQPLTLDGQVWIVADGRVDARDALAAELHAQNRDDLDLSRTSDAELLLRSYLTWGENCARHLLGDFACAIWDQRRHTLFCARDPFGLKLLYYARVGNCFMFSNTLNCMRRHPLVSNRLNGQALGDILLFGFNCDVDTTAFADIQRLPGGQTLAVSGQLVRQRQYWSPPVVEPAHYKRAIEYVDRFRGAMRLAVADRLRSEKASILMSGGLDSSAIAVTACEIAATRTRPLDLRAFTNVSSRAHLDGDGHYAGLAARALDIPIDYYVADDAPWHDVWDQPDLQTPEPNFFLVSLKAITHRTPVDLRGRIVLFGHGSDLAFKAGYYTARDMLRALPLNDVARHLAHGALTVGELPRLGTHIQDRIRRLRRPTPEEPELVPPFPAWVNADFDRQWHLRERWTQFWSSQPAPTHNLRYATYDFFLTPYEAMLHEWYDPSMSFMAWDVRYPFLDLRVLEVLLALPPVPWCIDKGLLRVAMRDQLPPAVLKRPKTARSGSRLTPDRERARRLQQSLSRLPRLHDFVDLAAITPETPPVDTFYWRKIPAPLHVANLGHWLHYA